MVDTDLRVLVVGAGIAGLAATRTLRLAGFRPELVERLPETAVATAGIFLPGNAARALRAIGLHEAVRPYGEVVTRQRVYSARGSLLTDVDLAQLWGAVGECRAMSRTDLHRVLLSGAGGQVRYEHAASGIEIIDGSAKVEFADGSRAEYDVVVGADGRRSAIRELTGLGGPARPLGQIAYRAVVSGGPDLDACTMWLGQRSSLLAVPMGSGRLYLYADEMAQRGRPPVPPDDPLARMRALLAGYRGPVPELLDLVDRVRVAALDEVDVPTWVRGPVVLVGDAAHATSPNMAQGAALALEDAVTLAEELSRGRDVVGALAGFQDRRRTRAAWVLAASRRRERPRRLPAPVCHAVLRWRGEAMFRDYYGPLLTAP